MSRRDVRTSRGLRATVVECDRSGCGETFRSASDPKLVEQQLVAAGWALIEVEDPRSHTWEKRVLCRGCRPTGYGRGQIGGRYFRYRTPQGQKGSDRSRIAD